MHQTRRSGIRMVRAPREVRRTSPVVSAVDFDRAIGFDNGFVSGRRSPADGTLHGRGFHHFCRDDGVALSTVLDAEFQRRNRIAVMAEWLRPIRSLWRRVPRLG